MSQISVQERERYIIQIEYIIFIQIYNKKKNSTSDMLAVASKYRRAGPEV